jgi:hypothetical protein
MRAMRAVNDGPFLIMLTFFSGRGDNVASS